MSFDINYFAKRILVIGRYLPTTLSIAILAMLFGIIIGLILALFKSEVKNRYVNLLIDTYISFFRGTPLMVQLFIFYFGLPQLFEGLSNVGAYEMSIAVMSLNAGAYMSVIIRSAISSVHKNQMEAAQSLGMGKLKAMVKIIIPQAARIAVPPLSNTFISLIQGTAITFILGVKDIMASAKVGASASYKFFENFLAVGIIYWIITLIISYLTKRIESRMNKSY
ncbi:amino acid ABC transporter permease [Oceanirhabdus sp. W0125-5]|uniref:amino acid ABC transporter permease n=1 Tax=Oceanirhabdus sp. W0125-5 TaxID=2999116 RepID=UPI0022F33861|nr:amino acid ABC transporter permease [Oceanirhabdus sp. W0125-5]WBW95507.1 amino acid ABC transporter permease [Oceanirhabdus sp. W0125-5]